MIKHEVWQGSHRFVLENDQLRLVLVSFGARIQELHFGGKDVVLGYDTMADIRRGPYYTGATVGRYANRIAGGRFALNGISYQLEKNEKDLTHIHGGTAGFDKVEWEWAVLEPNAVKFSRISPDGEMGYPGTLTLSVTYTLESDAVAITYEAATDRDTILNLTNHAYFNLDGFDGEDCRKMRLELAAPWVLPIDENLIPTGDPVPVDGTAFDFRTMREIAGEYDHCFVFGRDRLFQSVGTAHSPASGISMEIFTDLPAIQLYTCGWLVDTVGKGGIPLHVHQGIALETQFYPDSPNHPSYPSTVLKAGEVFTSTTKYRFFKS